MPRKSAKGSGMIRLRPDGRWEARVTVGRDPLTGKQRTKSFYGSTQAEVRKKLTEAAHDLDEGEFADSGSLTLGKWLDLWYDAYAVSSVKESTLRSYQDHIRLHIKPALGHVRLDKLTPLMIQRFYSDLAKNGRAPRPDRRPDPNEPPGLAPRTIRNIHNVLHAALRQASRPPHRLIKFNPADDLELPKPAETEMQILTAEEITALLTESRNDWHYPIFYVALFCGMRRGELLGLSWDNVDFDAQTITVSGQLQRERKKGGVLRIVPLKNNRIRTIYPASSVFAVLSEHKRTQALLRASAAARGLSWEHPEAVFTNPRGGYLEASAVYRSLMKYLSRIGVEDVRLHDLRHTFATMTLSTGADIKTLQETLGHKDPGFTLRVYGHADDRMKREAARKMDQIAVSLQTGTE